MVDYSEKILEAFEQVCAVPRCSKHEEKISRWLQDWASAHGLPVRSDSLGNVLITVPSSPGYENSPTLVLQGHMDMVCEKTPDSNHDFSKDPIRTIRQGDWLTADRTTLGADNGIAIAMCLVLAADHSLEHPNIEILITVDEEQGLTGAARLPQDFLSGRILLNIDSEDEGVFTVGCAGGREIRLKLALDSEKIPSGWENLRLTVGGLRGGHSGIDIEKQRASANKLLARLIAHLAAETPLRLVALAGGSAHNAIPRDASATVALESGKLSLVRERTAAFADTLRKEYAVAEKSVEVQATPSGPASGEAVSLPDTLRAVNLLLALPHGVTRMSEEIEGLVETSTNMATLRLEGGVLDILTSQRSSVTSRLGELCRQVEAVAGLAGATAETGSGYPAWQPDMQSPLLARCRELYKKMYGTEAVIEVIHAGLETAVLGDRFPGLDMISLGPTIQNPHSPEERINVPSTGKVFAYLLEVLKSYKS